MVKAQFLGHAGWRLTDGSATILIDPWLSGNPKGVIKLDDVKQADAILVSHAHSDHFTDVIPLARNTGATVISVFELVGYCQANGVKNGHGMNLGGAHEFPWGKVKLIQAFHTSSCGDSQDILALGGACGFILQLGGLTIYHAGDTALFGDMQLFARLHPLDLALLPIGDNYTMGPEDALEAVRLLAPKHVVPMHYNTFPLIEQDGDAWAEQVRGLGGGIECRAIQPGDEWSIG